MSDSESQPSIQATQPRVQQQPPVGTMAGIMPPGRLDTTGNMADNWKVHCMETDVD